MLFLKKFNCTINLNNKFFFNATSIGYKKNFYGEIVFNTSSIGYQEVITDPSYFNQIVVFSSSNIGTIGINYNDSESNRVWLSCVVIRNHYSFFSNFKSFRRLIDYLLYFNVIVLTSVNTRDLIKCLRKNIFNSASIQEVKTKYKTTNLNNKFLKYSSTDLYYSWSMNEYKNYITYLRVFKWKVLVIDCGVKYNILRYLSNKSAYTIISSYNISIEEIITINPNALIISNGPGAPSDYLNLVQTIKVFLGKIPILGICFGYQLISMAMGLLTKSMFLGHHGVNHPIGSLHSNRVYITSQNHNFVVNNKNSGLYSLFDGTNQGFFSRTHKLLGFQGHPEGAPGPLDMCFVFDKFFSLIRDNE